MKRLNTLPIVLALIAIGTITVSGQGPEKPKQGFLTAVKEGQSVNVNDVAGRFEITFDDATTDLSHKVTATGPDFVMVEDIGGLIETKIPVYSIKSIVRLKVPK